MFETSATVTQQFSAPRPRKDSLSALLWRLRHEVSGSRSFIGDFLQMAISLCNMGIM